MARAPAYALCLLLLSALNACDKQARVEQPTVAFQAPGEGAASYQSEPDGQPGLRGSHGDMVGRSLEKAAAGRSPALVPDGRLAQLAEWIAERLGPQATPPPLGAIELWMRHLGMPEPVPMVIVRVFSNDATLEAHMTEALAPELAAQPITHYGATAFLRDNGEVVCVTVLSTRQVTMRPVPRVVPPGTTLLVRGSIPAPLRDPKLVLTEPNGSTRRLDVRAGREFNAEIVGARGELRVEVLAESDLGSVVVANFPVYVGIAAPREVRVPVGSAGDEPLDERVVAERLLELVNEDRRRARLPPVTLDDALSSVALAHSRDMHEHAFIGHTSKTTGSAGDRLKRAGVRTDLVLENIGRGYSPEEVHQGLMESPGHRANVVHPNASHIGIGVVRQVDEGRSAYLVTEVFTRRAVRIDVDDAPDDLLDLINAERVRRGIDPLVADDDLAELADGTARAFFAPAPLSNDELVQALSRKAAAKPSSRYKATAALMTLVSALPDARGISALLDPKARGVGFGVAQGTRPDTMPEAIAIVVLLGY